jgi:hypothetical protein
VGESRIGQPETTREPLKALYFGVWACTGVVGNPPFPYKFPPLTLPPPSGMMYVDCFGPRNRRVMLASFPKIPAFSATHPPLGAASAPYGTARHRSRARVDLIHHVRPNCAGSSRPCSRACSGFALRRPRRHRLRRPRPWEFRHLEFGAPPYRRGPPSAISPVLAPLSSSPLSICPCSGSASLRR